MNFSSSKIHCASCLVKKHRNGRITYSRQLLGTTLVHPDPEEVIPLTPEPGIRQDGQTEDDCERNATRLRLKQLRQKHLRLPVIVVEDAFNANAPYLEDLAESDARSRCTVIPKKQRPTAKFGLVRVPASPYLTSFYPCGG
jgi:hypothetical protein